MQEGEISVRIHCALFLLPRHTFAIIPASTVLLPGELRLQLVL